MIDNPIYARKKFIKLLEEMNIQEHADLIHEVVDKLKEKKIPVKTGRNKLLAKIRDLQKHLWETERFLKELEDI